MRQIQYLLEARERASAGSMGETATSLFLYVMISGCALFVDFAAGWVVRELFDFEIPVASVIGYIVGLTLAFPLMGKLAFPRGRLGIGATSFRYVLSALLGISSTWVVATFVSSVFSQDYLVSKGFAAIVSFIVVYLFRRLVVFR